MSPRRCWRDPGFTFWGRRPYECVGDVPNVTFPWQRLQMQAQGELPFIMAVPTR